MRPESPSITIESSLVSFNKVLRGLAWERKASRHWHKLGIPLLVSSKLLRKRGCGQIDLGVIRSGVQGWKIYLIECKSEGVISVVQYGRLKKSAHFLSVLFNLPVSIEIFAKRANI